MPLAFHGLTDVYYNTTASATIEWVGDPNDPPPGDALIAVFGFQDVPADSGPWIVDTPGSGGWQRLLFQSPSATGSGLEVLHSHAWSAGDDTEFAFDTTYSWIARGVQYTGQLATGALVRAHAEQAWTGDDPQTPELYAFPGEQVIAVAATYLDAFPGYTTPAPWNEQFDNDLGGVPFGDTEIVLADRPVTVEGPISLTWEATADPSSAKGATGIFVLRPAVPGEDEGPGTPPFNTTPLLAIEYPVAS